MATYANAELRGDHDYNPQVVDRRLEVWEGDRRVGHAHCRYTYSWDNFFQRAIPVTLTTTDAPLRLVSPDGELPLIREVTLAPTSLCRWLIAGFMGSGPTNRMAAGVAPRHAPPGHPPGLDTRTAAEQLVSLGARQGTRVVAP